MRGFNIALSTRKSALFVAALCCGGMLASPAWSAASVYVSSGWDAYFEVYQDDAGHFGPLPAGVTVGCIGAAAFGVDGCSGGGTLSASNASGTVENFLVDVDGRLRITNASGGAIPGLLFFVTDFSAYLPGSQGVRVTDPAVEFASFSSSLFGPDLEDQHSCMTSPTIAACGVSSPDFSTTSFAVPIPASGQFVDEIYAGRISAQLYGVAEPPSWTYFALLLLLGPLARRKLFRRG